MVASASGPHGEALELWEGKCDTAVLRWRDDHIEWGSLRLRVICDREDPHDVQVFAFKAGR